MAALRVLRPPVCSDEGGTVPREQWPALIEERHRFCRSEIPSDCRMLLFFVQDAADNDWLGFADRESYIRDGLHLDPELVDWALVGLKRTKPELATPFETAVTLGQHGGARVRGEQGANGNLKRGTNSAAYTLARLRRDNPELAKRVIEGRPTKEQAAAGLMSANAAAITAGFRRRTVSLPIASAESAARIIAKHYRLEEIAEAWPRERR